MDTISPEHDRHEVASPDEAAHRRARRGRLVALALAVVVVAGVAYAANNERAIDATRVRQGTASKWPEGVNGSPVPMREISTLNYGDEWAISYLPGGEFQYGFNLTVEGSRPVTITSVEPVQPYGVDLIGRFLGRGDRNEVMGGSPTAGVTPFRPFTLRPRQYRWVGFRFRFFDCGPSSGPDGFTGGRDMVVRFKVDGRTRSNVTPLPWALAFEGIPSCDAYDIAVNNRRLEGKPTSVADDAVGVSGLPLD